MGFALNLRGRNTTLAFYKEVKDSKGAFSIMDLLEASISNLELLIDWSLEKKGKTAEEIQEERDTLLHECLSNAEDFPKEYYETILQLKRLSQDMSGEMFVQFVQKYMRSSEVQAEKSTVVTLAKMEDITSRLEKAETAEEIIAVMEELAREAEAEERKAQGLPPLAPVETVTEQQDNVVTLGVLSDVADEVVKEEVEVKVLGD